MTLAQDPKHIAEQLFNAEKNGAQIGIITEQNPHMDMDDAYIIQDMLIAHKKNSGGRQVGWKIGLTSKAMQYALNIDIPDSGVLFDDMVFKNGCVVPQGRFIQPRIEAEIAFVMKSDVVGDSLNESDILNATDYITPSLEILDTRIIRKNSTTGAIRRIYDTIADNAANAGLVLGDDRFSPHDTDMRWLGAIVSRDNEIEETGLGAGVLNNPAISVLWLANRLAEYGQHMQAGDIVLSGSFIRPIEAPCNSHFVADFGDFGLVSCAFE